MCWWSPIQELLCSWNPGGISWSSWVSRDMPSCAPFLDFQKAARLILGHFFRTYREADICQRASIDFFDSVIQILCYVVERKRADFVSCELLYPQNLVALDKGKDEKVGHYRVIYMRWFLARSQSIIIESWESLRVFASLGKCEVFHTSSGWWPSDEPIFTNVYLVGILERLPFLCEFLGICHRECHAFSLKKLTWLSWSTKEQTSWKKSDFRVDIMI
jgi:hypothetical protein